MKIITGYPVLIGKGCYGVWRVKVFYFDGRKHEQDYVAFTSSEAKRRYMMEFGAVHQGCMYTEFIKKIPMREESKSL
jgi:hypothetical protein